MREYLAAEELDNTAYLLDGLEDRTGGLATAYFADLSDADRRIVQDFAREGIAPYFPMVYIDGLVRGYAGHDPRRLYSHLQATVNDEIAKMQRAVTLYRQSVDYYPEVNLFYEPMIDDGTGEVSSLEVMCWSGNARDGVVFFGIDLDDVDDFLNTADDFVRDPAAEPAYRRRTLAATPHDVAQRLKDWTSAQDPDRPAEQLSIGGEGQGNFLILMSGRHAD